MTAASFRQVRGSIEDVCDTLTFDGCALLHRLIQLADWRTGEFPCTREALAAHLRIGQNRLVRALDELERAGLVVRDFRRGHDGKVRVLAYPDLVRLPTAEDEALRARLSQRPERMERAGETLRNVGSGWSDQGEPATSEADGADPSATFGADGGNVRSGWSDQGSPIYTSTRATSTEAPVASAVPNVEAQDPGCQSCGAVPSPAGWCSSCEPFASEPEEEPEPLPAASSPPVLRTMVPVIVPVPLPPGLHDLPLSEMGWCRECGRATVTTTDDGALCRQCHAAGAHLEVSA